MDEGEFIAASLFTFDFVIRIHAYNYNHVQVLEIPTTETGD